MAAIALGLFAAFKILSAAAALRAGVRPPAGRLLAYLLLWPGMDAEAFLGPARVPPPPPAAWAGAAARILLGAALLWGVLPRIPSWPAALRAWIGLVGLAFLLHFGLFRLAALFWQARGVRAEPLMDAPARARSLSEFWGRRWNRAFRDLAHRFVFEPVRRRAGPGVAGGAAFAVSGLLHDLALSLPAGGGWGLPTAYFLLQALGIRLERSACGRRLGLGRGFRGWLFAAAFTAGPAAALFHPPFLERVAIPFLQALGAW
jgi:alginate O-acetyltransferase complex protein AlgI